MRIKSEAQRFLKANNELSKVIWVQIVTKIRNIRLFVGSGSYHPPIEEGILNDIPMTLVE